MVGMMSPISRERIASLLNSAKYVPDVRTKLHVLRQLKDELTDADSPLLSEFLPPLLDLVSDRFSPVRKLTAEMIGYIGFKHGEFLPDIVPVLISALKDDTPAVARLAITCGIDIFRCTLVKVAIQGLFSSELDDSLVSAWAWVLKFRDAIYTMAFQPASDGRTLLALKFVESVVLLYTADPSVSSELPPALDIEGKFEQFNVSWLRGGHPVLNVGDLAVEASQSLGLLLDQLRFPAVKSITNLMIIVLINCLSAIATKRPAFYGRILPVLFSLDPSSSDSNGKHVSGVHHALKNAFVSCLNCTHPGAAPWRDRLEGALREKKGGIPAEEASNQVCENNGHIEMKDVSSISEDSKLSMKALDAGLSITGTKRSGAEDNAELADDNPSKKRIRSAPTVSEAKKHESSGNQERVSTGGSTTTKTDIDSDAVQQLIGMFSAIVAQGDKAVVSLEILIPSIAADLLADVVMANMRNLPPYQPNVDNDEDPRMKPENESDFKRLSSLLTDILSQSSTLAQKDEGDAQSLVSIELEQGGEEHLDLVNTDATPDDVNYTSEQAPEYVTETLTSSKSTPPTMVDDVAEVPSEVTDFGNMENFIPGLDSVACKDESSELVVLSSVDPSELEDGGQEQVSSLVRSPLELVPSVSTDRSEELSPKAAVTDVTSMNSSTSTSFGLSLQLLLPKIAAPVINLSDEQNDNLQTSAFSRVIDAYKQVTAAGGSQVRFSILANLGVEFPSELNPWKFLQTHILSDYINHEGHELTLRVLYRLYGRAEEDQDFLSSTAATSVYETFLLTVAETLKDSFPASDKSLSRLLGEAPYLPKSILEMLESFCCPGSSEKDEKELHSGDRVTQGLSTVWNLILLRPPIREACLRIALQSAVHHLEEVRMKAIRLVANKLYPLSSISQQIELFASEKLLSVSNVGMKADSNGDGSNPESQKDFALEKPSEEEPSVSVTPKDASSDTLQSSTSESVSAFSIAEGQRCMSLYFALCTKKHSLFAQIFVVYGGASKAVKQAIHQQIPMLVRTIGTSSELLEVISDPPSGSDKLLMQVLQTLTEGTVPSLQLIATIRKLYETKVKDVELLIMILPSLSKEEVLLLFPHIVNVPLDKFQGALSRVLQGSAQSGPLLTPAEALIAIHGIDPERDGIPLKKVTDACNACFEQREIFSQQVLAKVLNQLVEQIPLPLLFMRTVIQTIGAFPSLVEFIMDILSRLVNKQIWKYPKQWVGFVKCAHLTKPQSFTVLLQLPPAQLENALSRTPGLRAPLVAHATQPHIKSSLPRSVLTVLGIASDAQVSSQAHPIQSQTANTGNSDKEAVTEITRESSIAS